MAAICAKLPFSLTPKALKGWAAAEPELGLRMTAAANEGERKMASASGIAAPGVGVASFSRVPQNLSAQRDGVELSCARDDIVDSRKPQTLPRHRVIAGGDEHADALLEPRDGLGDA